MYDKYPTGKRGAAHETQFTRHVNPYLQRSDVLIILELLFIAAEGVSSQPCRVQTFRTVSIHTSHSCWARQTCNLGSLCPAGYSICSLLTSSLKRLQESNNLLFPHSTQTADVGMGWGPVRLEAFIALELVNFRWKTSTMRASLRKIFGRLKDFGTRRGRRY